MAEKLVELVQQSNTIVYPSKAAVIKQASPDSTFLDPTNLEAFSNANDTYEGATLSKKTVLFFPEQFAAGRTHLLVLPTDFRFDGTELKQNFYWRVTTTGVPAAPLGNLVLTTLTMRVRPFTGTTGLTGATWNTFNSQVTSFGSGITLVMGVRTDVESGVGTVTLGQPPGSGISVSFNQLTFGTSFAIRATAPITGLVIDCKAASSGSAGTTTVTEAGYFGAAISRGGIFLVKSA